MRDLALREPLIVLGWLGRLRWLAVVGQVSATLVAVLCLGLSLPVPWMIGIIALTAVSNLLLALLQRRACATSLNIPRGIVPAVVLLDMLLLSAVLYLSGGSTNPFAILFVVHVAIAVVLLPGRQAWLMVGAASLFFAALTVWHQPLESASGHISRRWHEVGSWLALVLSCGLIAYFIGRVQRALRQRDEELQTFRIRAERSERLAAVTALAAGAAHELGSPLGTIAVVSKELELASTSSTTPSGLAPELIDDIRLIRQEVDRCRGILTRMRLDVGDDLNHKSGEMDAQSFADGAIADLTDDRKPRVRIEISPESRRIEVPSRAIVRAVGVLLRNGFEASPHGAEVMLRIRIEAGEGVAEVQDQGTGMPPEILARAGEPFFTTKELGRGMGMGLFIVKLIAEQSNGRLVLQSQPGQGTIAQLRWKLARSPASTR